MLSEQVIRDTHKGLSDVLALIEDGSLDATREQAATIRGAMIALDGVLTGEPFRMPGSDDAEHSEESA